MTYRLRNLLLAVALALVAMLLTLFYVTNVRRSVEHGAATVTVYVAARDVAAGTSGSDLAREHAFRTAQVARSTVVPGAISSPGQVQNLVLNGPLFAGEQVTLRRFTDVKAQGIRAQLKGSLRAVEVSGDSTQVLAGTLAVGDHVDVVANLSLDQNTNTHASRIVLRDLAVLALPGSSTSAKVANQNTDVILAVTDTQVQRLFYVLHNADWALELRPVVDAADSRERVEGVNSILTAGVR